jgi:hypothetical protein
VQQLEILRAINPLKLSAEQTTKLLDVLRAAEQKSAEQELGSARQLVAVVPQLRQAQPQALAAPGQTTPAEVEFRRVVQSDNQVRRRLRGELRNDLRALLEKILTPEQQSALVATGHALNVQQRLQEVQEGDRGPIEGFARSLDRLRQADPRRYAQERQSFATRTAGVFAGDAPAGPGDVAGGRGPRGGDVAARADRARRADEAALRREQLRAQLNDPAVQARMRPYLAMADQIRSMPEAAYQQQRMKLALQVWQAGEQQRVQTNPQQAVNQFIDRVLLQPAAADTLKLKLERTATQ